LGGAPRLKENDMMRARAGLLAIPTTAAALAVALAGPAPATVPGGQTILHVPMAWCIVNGSPAQAAPNVLSEGTTVADTNTDAVIWRRHERPTDNVYLPQASISLRSAINDAWGTFNFPLLNDTDTSVGQTGDIVSGSAEETALVNACDQSYAASGRAGIGITAVNVNLFRDGAGNYQGQVGVGGCGWVGSPSNGCTTDFFIIVGDNHYYYPTVTNRNIAGWGTPLADPLDLAVGHETGHALGLSHRSDTSALMNPSLVDNNGDGRVENTALNTAERALARMTAGNVPGLETDPARKFVPGPILAMRLVDGPQDSALAPHLDLAALTASLDRRSRRFHLAQRLWGLLPCKALRPVDYDFVSDLDNSAATGATGSQLAKLRVPGRLRGADLVARVTVRGSDRRGRDFSTCQSEVRAWVIRDRRVVTLRRGSFAARIRTVRFYRLFTSPIDKPQAALPPLFRDVFNTIDFEVANRVLPNAIKAKRPFRATGQIVTARKIRDRLGKSERGERFVLQQPRFPHCFPAGAGTPGGTVPISFDGMLPHREVHALLGPTEVLRGVQTDGNGAGRLNFPIPKGTRPGNHLVTIGHDGLALTADCTLSVTRG
jgi:hypothetical protein